MALLLVLLSYTRFFFAWTCQAKFCKGKVLLARTFSPSNSLVCPWLKAWLIFSQTYVDCHEMCSQSSDSEGSGSSVSSGDKAATSAATRNSDSDSTDTEAESVVTEGASRSEVEDSPDQVWEICCHPRSRLTRCCRLAGLVCRRLTLETGYDFALAKASSKALQLAERKKSKIFWISVPCKAYSPLQNMRKYGNTAKSRKVLARKQADTDKIVENTLSPC